MKKPNSPPRTTSTYFWIATALTLSLWIFGLIAVVTWFILSIALIPAFPIPSSISLAVIIIFMTIPLDLPPPPLIQKFLRFTCLASFRYYPVRMVYEDREALEKSAPFVIAYEPHSVLPQGMCAFCEWTPEVPPSGLANARILVSSAGFWPPLMRHMWWWLGCRPASRTVAGNLLSQGNTIALCPGGVRECLYMAPGTEVAYLRKRHGFVKLALEHGAPLVPVFAFGQSGMFSYCRPFLDFPRNVVSLRVFGKVARRIGFAPMMVWGVWGTPMPHRVPLTIVVGRPIEMPPLPKGTTVAPPALVEEYLGKFINELEALFETHKVDAGGLLPEERLTVY